MNVIGERVTVLGSSDPTQIGISGTAVMETLNTLLLDVGGRKLRLAKEGSAFRLLPGGAILKGADIRGRLEDRLGRRKR